jgi:hypothetical protein
VGRGRRERAPADEEKFEGGGGKALQDEGDRRAAFA